MSTPASFRGTGSLVAARTTKHDKDPHCRPAGLGLVQIKITRPASARLTGVNIQATTVQLTSVHCEEHVSSPLSKNFEGSDKTA